MQSRAFNGICIYIYIYIYVYIEFTALAYLGLGVQACPFSTRGGQGMPVKGARKPKNSVKANLKEV